MDKTKLKYYQIFSAIFTIILGTILHFTYEWSGESKIVASFSAINESTWEHLKLIFFPMVITLIIGCFYLGKVYPNLICSKTRGIIFSMMFMVIFFYTYTGILGKSIGFINIVLFFISVILGELVSYLLIINNLKCSRLNSIFILIVIMLLFIIFTFYTPEIGIFRDPLHGNYGI